VRKGTRFGELSLDEAAVACFDAIEDNEANCGRG
jgi:hypothetical protein